MKHRLPPGLHTWNPSTNHAPRPRPIPRPAGHSKMRRGNAHGSPESLKRVTGTTKAPCLPTPAPTEEPDNFPPAFYDSLPTIFLTTRALRELNRRNRERQMLENAVVVTKKRKREETLQSDDIKASSHRPQRRSKVAAQSKLGVSPLARFACQGGPDLSDIRGMPSIEEAKLTLPQYPEPAVEEEQENDMPGDMRPPPVPPSAPSSVPSSAPMSANRTSETSSKSRRSSAYDSNFEYQLVRCLIFPPSYNYRTTGKLPPLPANWDQVYNKLSLHRRSVSPSILSESRFMDFRIKSWTSSESTIMDLLKDLNGTSPGIQTEGNVLFTNIVSITDGLGVSPKPDSFDGAALSDLHPKVRDTLCKYIIPSLNQPVPVAPNFFMEVKTENGSPRVAVLQIIHNGAYGAMMMRKLQVYANNITSAAAGFDNNAYCFSATFAGSNLTLYAHHLMAPDTPDDRPKTFTSVLDCYAMGGNPMKWREGIKALRNLREHAKEVRDNLITDANSRARNLAMTEVKIPSPSLHAYGPIPSVETGQDDAAWVPTTAQKGKAPATTPARAPVKKAVLVGDDSIDDDRSSSFGEEPLVSSEDGTPSSRSRGKARPSVGIPTRRSSRRKSKAPPN
ncbi:hypothetical protein F503_01192 [Ophiostoma piceae UAMH 11346]|uniref:Uncharacterized protein n=1 Tax=Ophiostoma piceae (strain UAMH 11346) TaxID=1262450 RepID=S3C4G3_OPHP1|nr:hypothetical protein F503_01192 [Ophiostoma piceae UAMH 11346]